MSRKNTILLAILINTGLLVILFISAMTTQEEIAIAPTHELSISSTPAREVAPLFNEELDLSVKTPEVPVAAQQEVKEPVQTPVVHALPPPSATMAAPSIPSPIPAASVEAPSSMREIVVKKGDSLEKIAKAHQVTVEGIIRLNHLTSHFLRIGQKLKIPNEKVAVEMKSVENVSDYYIVKVGDNPWTIAMKHHLKVDELLKLNGLNQEKARKLKPGDRLRIR